MSTVKESVTLDRLAEDVELELSDAYPKPADLQLQAVLVLMPSKSQAQSRKITLPNNLESNATL